MQYIKYTYVDALTGVPVTVAPAANGPAVPAVGGLEYAWARESAYPTEQPEFFGTCPDESAIDVPGVLAQMTQAEWEALRADEMLARNPVPATVTRAQGKAALIQAGLWSGVLAYVAGIEDETQRALAEVALHDTTLWQRSSPFLTAAAHALGMSDDALDALFVAAAGVEL